MSPSIYCVGVGRGIWSGVCILREALVATTTAGAVEIQKVGTVRSRRPKRLVRVVGAFNISYSVIKIDNEFLQHGLLLPTIDSNQNTNPVNVRN